MSGSASDLASTSDPVLLASRASIALDALNGLLADVAHRLVPAGTLHVPRFGQRRADTWRQHSDED